MFIEAGFRVVAYVEISAGHLSGVVTKATAQREFIGLVFQEDKRTEIEELIIRDRAGRTVPAFIGLCHPVHAYGRCRATGVGEVIPSAIIGGVKPDIQTRLFRFGGVIVLPTNILLKSQQ